MTDVDTLVQRKAALEKSLNSWQSKAAVASADAERIKKELSALLASLKEDYGCASYEEAVALRDELLEKYSNLCDTLEEQLDALGG